MAWNTKFRWQNAILQVTRGHHHGGQWSWETGNDNVADAAKNDQRRISIVPRAMAKSPSSQGTQQGTQQETAFSPELALLPKTGDTQDRLPLAPPGAPSTMTPTHRVTVSLNFWETLSTNSLSSLPLSLQALSAPARPFPPSPNSSWRAPLF